MSNQSGKSVISNLIWRFAERCGAQGVEFVVTIVLARILAPEHYGTIALVTVFTTILNVFVNSGLASALIQKKDADDLDFSSVFYFNVTMCIILYLGMFFAAPFIAAFYNKPELTAVVRVLSLTLVLSGVKNVQQAFVSRTLQFKRFFYATLGGTLGAAALGILMAMNGYGVWALVAQQLFNTTVDTLILWITVEWRPRLIFSFQRLKMLFSYGWKLLASSLLDTISNNISQLIIGKMYSSQDLAMFNRGKTFPHVVITNVNTAIDSVLFPVISAKQDDRDQVKNLTRRAIRTSSYVIWPVVIGLAACATPIVTILLKEKWLPCVPFMQICCVTYGFMPVHTANLNAIKAMGRSDIFLKLEIYKKIIGLVFLISAMPFGPLAIAFSILITSPIAAFINASPNRKLLDYSYREQIQDMIPSMLLALTMGAIVMSIAYLGMPVLLQLVLQIITGVIIYIAGSLVFRLESLSYILMMLKKFKK